MHCLLLLGLSGLPMWTTAERQTRSSLKIDWKLSYPFEISRNRCYLRPETWEISEDWLSALEFPLFASILFSFCTYQYFILRCCALPCVSYNSSLLWAYAWALRVTRCLSLMRLILCQGHMHGRTALILRWQRRNRVRCSLFQRSFTHAHSQLSQ